MSKKQKKERLMAVITDVVIAVQFGKETREEFTARATALWNEMVPEQVQ